MAERSSDVLLTGIARGRGGAEMMLELLAVLHGKGVLSEEEVQRVISVLAADMREFDLELRGTLPRAASLRG